MRKYAIAKRLIAGVLSVIFAFRALPVSLVPVYAEDSLQELQGQRDQAKERIQQEQSEVSDAKSKKDSLEGQVSTVATDIGNTQKKIDETNASILALQDQLSSAEAERSNRLAAMKKRIRFMYEEGSHLSMLSILASSSNFAEFLAKFNYTADLSQYEQKHIKALEELQTQINQNRNQLSKQQKVLEDRHSSLGQQQEQLQELLANASEDLRNQYSELTGAQKQLDQIDQAIASMQAALEAEERRNQARKQAEAERIMREAAQREAAERAAQNQSQNNSRGKDSSGSSTSGSNGSAGNSSSSGSSSSGKSWKDTHPQGQAGTDYWVSPMSYSQQELDELTTIIYAEAAGEGYKVMLGVGSVVLNRVRNRSFPNSIHGVIFASGQFEPTWLRAGGAWSAQGKTMFQYFYDQRDYMMSHYRAYQNARQAALDVLSGKRNTNLCFFWSVSNSKPAGSIIMGRTVFFGSVIQTS